MRWGSISLHCHWIFSRVSTPVHIALPPIQREPLNGGGDLGWFCQCSSPDRIAIPLGACPRGGPEHGLPEDAGRLPIRRGAPEVRPVPSTGALSSRPACRPFRCRGGPGSGSARIGEAVPPPRKQGDGDAAGVPCRIYRPLLRLAAAARSPAGLLKNQRALRSSVQSKAHANAFARAPPALARQPHVLVDQ